MTPAQVAEAVFDSHRFVKRLTGAGMEEGLAEALAEEHMGRWIRNVATKTDVANIQRDAATKVAVANIHKDLENLRRDAATKADVANIRKELENLRRDAATKADVANIRKELESTRVMFRKDLENLRRDAATKADVANAIAAAERRLMLAMIGVAGVLFAALRLSQ